MTEKTIFAYKLFFSLNISDFKLQYPVKKVTPCFPATPSKSRDPVKFPPFFGNSTPRPPQEKGGRCTLWVFPSNEDQGPFCLRILGTVTNIPPYVYNGVSVNTLTTPLQFTLAMLIVADTSFCEFEF